MRFPRLPIGQTHPVRRRATRRSFSFGSTVVPGESEDERVERAAAEAAENVESLLHDIGLSAGERAFCKTVGEGLVDQACDAFVKAQREQKGYDGACIAASVAVALMIVREPP